MIPFPTAPQPATTPLMPMLPQEVKPGALGCVQSAGSSPALCETAYSPIEYVRMDIHYSGGPGGHEPRVCPAGSIAAVTPEVAAEWCDEHRWGVRI